MYDYQQNAARKDAERERVAYEKALAKYDAINMAADEGVFQVTIQSDSGTITMPVSFVTGRDVATWLAEAQAAWLKQVEKYLNSSLVNLGEETEVEQNRVWLRQEQAEEAAAQRRAAFQAEAQQIRQEDLAQQAAATAAPKQVGRPRKPRPQPELVGQMAGAAAAVPMNGSTAHAAARATGSTPQA
ncbi:MAG: hypothetical protein ACRYFX_18925 [Janthinobacterium lividum]